MDAREVIAKRLCSFERGVSCRWKCDEAVCMVWSDADDILADLAEAGFTIKKTHLPRLGQEGRGG